ncbi:MAG: hypothetical protein ACR2QF_14460 [Geminicoccaceae bacterium]
MLARLAVTAVMIALSLSACVRDPSVGTGPIELSPRVQAGFEAYQKERAPGHFAVSIDGEEAAYNYCPDGRCVRGSKTEAIHRCEKRSGGMTCKIYGANGEVVRARDADAGS